jgi:hypothetical protein
MSIAFYILLAVQALCWSIFLFGDIGFDRPGKYGLDYPALVVIGAVYAVALVSGIVLGVMKKRWLAACSQFIPILAALLYVYLPYPKYDPAHYQDLVGKRKEEVERRIGHPRGAATGLVSDERHKDAEFIALRGMTIYMSLDGVVLGVEGSGR